MPKPTYYGIMTTSLYTTLLMSFGHFIMPPEKQFELMADFAGLGTDGNVKRPEIYSTTVYKEAVVSNPKKVETVTSNLSDIYEKTLVKLAATDQNKEPYTHAMLTAFSNITLVLLNGADSYNLQKGNPFFDAFTGRTPDLISPQKFARRPPVTDPDVLIEKLKEPKCELAGYSEIDALMQRFPFASMMEKLSVNMVHFEDALHNHDKLSLKQQETLRQEMLEGCRSIIKDAKALADIPPQNMAAFSKIFNPPNRANAVAMDWKGPRGIEVMLIPQIEDVQKALENHVPFSHLDVMVKIIGMVRNLDGKFALPGMTELKGFDIMKKEHQQLKDLINTDFSTLSPEQAAAHMNQIGTSSRALVSTVLKVKSQLPPETPPEELRKLSEPEKALADQNDTLSRALGIVNISGGDFSDSFLNAKLSNNKRLDVMGAAPPANIINQPQDNVINQPQDNAIIQEAPQENQIPNNNINQPQVNPNALEDDDLPMADEDFLQFQNEPEPDRGIQVNAPHEEIEMIPHITVDAHLNDGKPFLVTNSTLGDYLMNTAAMAEHQENPAFFGEDHAMQGGGLLQHFTANARLPWTKDYSVQTLSNGAGEAEVRNYFTSAHEEALKSFKNCDREKTPLTYAMRSYAEFYTGTASAGMALETEKAFNPFFSALSSRVPNFIQSKDFSHGAPVTDPGQLIEQLKAPEREVSCREELEILAKRYPLADMMCELADNAKRFQMLRAAGPDMSEEERSALRQQMLVGCVTIKQMANTIKDLPAAELQVMSKMYAPGNREAALERDQMGDRGIVNTVLQPVSVVEKILENGVDPDRMSAYLSAYETLDKIKKQLDGHPMLYLLPNRGAGCSNKIAELTALLDTDLSEKSPEERKQHYEALANGMTGLHRLGKDLAKHLPHLPGPSERGPAHPDKSRTDDLIKLLTNWSTAPEFIVNSLKDGDSYKIGDVPQDLPPAAHAENGQQVQGDPAAAGQPAQGAPAQDNQQLIDSMREQAEIISNLYLHLHNEGHSVGVDSSEYRHFRNAVKAVHQMWNPPENRRLDLNTMEGREQARNLFQQVRETANAYYLKHAGRNIKSTYGNIRRNAALTAIDTVDSQMAQDYIKNYAGPGMKMVKGDTIIREQISMEDLIRNEKAYSTLQFGNRNSKPYRNAADKVHKLFQDDEDQDARNQNRAPQKVNKEDAVNRYLGRRNHH